MFLWLRLFASTSQGMGLIAGQGTKIPHAAQHGPKSKKKVSLSWHFTQTTEGFLLTTEKSLWHSSDFLGYSQYVNSQYLEYSPTILFYFPPAGSNHKGLLKRQHLSFPAWALHPQFHSKYSQVWSVIVISHCSWTLRAFVLERSWAIALSLINPSRTQTPLGSRAP